MNEDYELWLLSNTAEVNKNFKNEDTGFKFSFFKYLIIGLEKK